MSPIVWLAIAIGAAVLAYLVGWPAWGSYRSRESRDLNAERYLAWRGRAVRGRPPASEGMTGEERRRVAAGVGLGILAVIGLVAFFAAS